MISAWPRSGSQRWLLSGLAAGLVFGACCAVGYRTDRHLRTDLLREARIAARALNPDRIRALGGRPADIAHPDYRRLKDQLASICAASPNYRFVYLLAIDSNRTVRILVDSEPATSAAYSPPGEVFTNALPAEIAKFRARREFVGGPGSDRWGTWVTAFVPLPGANAAGDVVLGLDVDARDWTRTILFRAALPAALAGAAILLAFAVYLLQRNRRALYVRQAKLTETSARFAQIAAQSRTFVWETDADGRFTHASAVAQPLFGYGPADLVGRRQLTDLRAVSGRAAFADALARAAAGQPLIDFENEARTADDRTLWLATNAVALIGSSGDVRGYRGSDLDVTARKLAEDALRTSEQKWRTVFDSLGEAAVLAEWIRDDHGRRADYRLTDGNETLDRLLGKPKSAWLGLPATQLFGLPDPPFFAEFTNMAETGRPSHFESHFEPLDRHFWVSAVPLDANRFIVVAMDISDRIRSEDRIRALLAESDRARRTLLSLLEDEQRIRERLQQHVADLNRAQAALMRSEKLAALGQLVSEVAHEISNPLMIISCNAQIARLPQIGPEETAAKLRIVAEECQRAKTILRRLLRFSSPGRGRPQRLDPAACLEAVAAMLEPQLKWARIDILRNYAPGLPPVDADESQLQEVFMNLINNAKDAMPDGGTLTLAAALAGDRVRLGFRDTGLGIAPEAQASLFKPFFTTKDDGTGLGMTICQSIVKAHGGEISFESRLGAGTEFAVYLPCAASPAAAHPGEPAPCPSKS